MNGVHFISGQWPFRLETPTLVFIHGVGNSSVLWKSQVEWLAGGLNTVALDLPGHGGSPGNGMDSVRDYAACVAEFIESIQAPEPIPCGISMGGAITLQMLLDGGIRYKAGIVINSGVRLKVTASIFDLVNRDYRSFALSMTTSCISAKTDPAKLEEVTAAALICKPQVVYNDFLACNSFNVTDILHHIEVPVLVITADEDRLTPPKFGRYMAERISDAQLAHIMDAGHMSPVEKPEDVNLAIREFVEKTTDG